MILNNLLSSKNNLHNHKNADTKNSKAQSLFKKLKAPFIVFLAILTIGTVYLGFTTNQAKADGETNNSSKETIIKKTLINDLQYCYENNTLMPPTVPMTQNGSINQNDISPLFFEDESTVKLPNNGFINPSFSGKITCEQLFTGNVNNTPEIKGLYREFKDNIQFNISQMSDLGYTASNQSEKNCVSFLLKNVYTVKNGIREEGKNVLLLPACFTTIGDLDVERMKWNTITTVNKITIEQGYDFELSGNTIKDGDNTIRADYVFYLYNNFGSSPISLQIKYGDENIATVHGKAEYENEVEPSVTLNTPDQIIDTTYETLFIDKERGVNEDDNSTTTLYLCLEEDAENPLDECIGKTTYTEYSIKKGYSTFSYQYDKTSYDEAFNFFTNEDANNNPYLFNNEDRLFLLESYIKKAVTDGKLGLSLRNSDCVDLEEMKSDNEKYYLKVTSGDLSGKWCPIDTSNADNNTEYYVIKNFRETELQWLMEKKLIENDDSGVLDRYRYLVQQGIPPVGIPTQYYQDWDNPDQTEQSTTIITDRCMTEISLGWVFCHIMRFAANGADWLYNTIMADMLTMSPSYFQNNMIEDVWQTVTNIANVAMIVILLIIIFSQLTGIGIDNYGIKKTLPKLIIVAILINLSFIICKACIDISNILGNSLNDWLSNLTIGEEITLADDSKFDSTATDSWFTVLFSTLTLGAGIFAGVSIKNIFTSEEGRFSSLFLPLLLLVLTAAFALLFLFLLLGLRQAGIIILVIAAPLAILCYTLPNTKKIYSKWFKSFQGLLILYPICGALIGGGTFISKLLVSLNPGSYTMIFIGSIIMVVPFFLIPSLLKGSFKAMGNIGATVSGYGRRMRSWSTKRVDSGIRNSARFKRGVEQSRQLRQSIRDIKRGDRAEERVKRIGGFEKLRNDRQRLRYSEAIRAKNAATTKMAEFRNPDLILDETIAKNRRQSTLEAQEMRNHSERLSELTHDGIKAELNQAVAEYDPSNIQTRIRLQATIREAEKRSMNKEMLTSLNTLQLSAGESNGNDIKILDELAKSNNKIVSQYGKQMSKNPAENLSMEDFTKSNSAVKLSNALLDIGPNALNGIDDDTLDYLRSKNPNAITPDMIINGAASATNQKQIKQYNDLLANQIADPMKIKNIKLTGNQLAKLDESTARLLGAGAISDSDLRKQVIDASERILNSPELLSSLNPLAKKHINTVRTSAGMVPLP